MAITTPNIVASTTTSDQQKFIAAKLLQRSQLKLVCSSICMKVDHPTGHGNQATFIRYNRMNVPLTSLTEGTDPSQSTISLASVTVTMDQWGDVLALSDISQLETMHPLFQQATELLADNAQRVIDREVQIVWMAGTNVQYGDGSVTSRSTVTSSMKLSDTVIQKARISLVDGGAPPRNGPESGYSVADANKAASINGPDHYVAVAGPQVLGDIQVSSASFGSWAAVSTYKDAMRTYNAEVGTWLGIRWVETNFIPKFTMLGNTTTAVASGNAFGTDTPVVSVLNGASGALSNSTTYRFKVTRKKKDRGFEEAISIEHSMATGASDDAFTFNFSGLTAGYVYNVYFGSSTGDANLKLAHSNVEVGTTVTVNEVPTSTTTAPANVNTTGTPTIHPVFIHGARSCAWVGLQQLKTFVSGDQATTDNPLLLRKTVGYKFMGKAVILDQNFMLRLEVASTY